MAEIGAYINITYEASPNYAGSVHNWNTVGKTFNDQLITEDSTPSNINLEVSGMGGFDAGSGPGGVTETVFDELGDATWVDVQAACQTEYFGEATSRFDFIFTGLADDYPYFIEAFSSYVFGPSRATAFSVDNFQTQIDIESSYNASTTAMFTEVYPSNGTIVLSAAVAGISPRFYINAIRLIGEQGPGTAHGFTKRLYTTLTQNLLERILK